MIEVRSNFLSYQIQRIQRNKYITIMVIYVTIMLNVYLRLLFHIYQKSGDFVTDNAKLQDVKVGDKNVDRTSSITAALNRKSSGSDNRGSATVEANVKV